MSHEEPRDEELHEWNRVARQAAREILDFLDSARYAAALSESHGEVEDVFV